MRGTLFLLCLVVCFLFGLLYGVDHDRTTQVEVREEPVVETVVETPVVSEPVEEVKLVQSDTTPAYKAASALESVVNFFYEIIVAVLYAVSQLFY